jgi:hypothetical protein
MGRGEGPTLKPARVEVRTERVAVLRGEARADAPGEAEAVAIADAD